MNRNVIGPSLEDRIKSKLARTVAPKSVRSTLGKLDIQELDANHPLSVTLNQIVDRPERSPEDKIKRQNLIDSIILTKPEAILFLRHKLASRSESGLVTDLSTAEERISRSCTGTVLKTNPFYEKTVRESLMGFEDKAVEDVLLSPGKFIRFSVYAPFSFFSDYPEVQLIGWSDVIAILKNMPSEVVED